MSRSGAIIAIYGFASLLSLVSGAAYSQQFQQRANTDTLGNILCAPTLTSPLTGKYPPSAVTTKQTGKNCTQYGDAPAEVVSDLESPDGLQDLVDICNGEIITIKDYQGTTRSACFYANPASTEDNPLPLLVWLHPSLVSPSLSFPITGIDAVRTTQSLNNQNTALKGFSYILPLGRNTKHFYPVPDNQGLGWDNWYRNLNRRSSTLNVDVDFLDKSIAYAKSNVPVDSRRVFMSGWSNGAAMALEYSLNTPGIASASVYSAPDPYRDTQDPCTQVPHPTFATPTQDIHNYCDLWGICTTGKYFYDDLARRYPALKQSLVIIDIITMAVKSQDAKATCDPACQSTCSVTQGTAAHLRWPLVRNNDTFFAFLRNNPLPASGSWGTPH